MNIEKPSLPSGFEGFFFDLKEINREELDFFMLYKLEII